MRHLRAFLSGLKALFGKDKRSQELEEELQSYLEAVVSDKMRKGMSHPEAMRAARVEFGSMEAVKEEIRSSGWESAVDSLWQDVRYGMRQLQRSPAFSAVAIATLALGIGANTAIFTLVHAVLLKQLPVADPQQLYRIGDGDEYCCEWGGLQDSWGIFDYPFYKHMRDTNQAFEQIAAFSGNTPTFGVRRAGVADAPQSIHGEFVSGNYFDMLGLQSAAGRLLSPSDDRPESSAVAVMSYRTWRQRFAADPAIVGSVLLVNDLPVTLVGIAPPGYVGSRLTSSPPELWLPLNRQPAFEGQGPRSMLYSSGMAWLYVIGRLRPDIAPAAVESQLSTQLQQWLRAEGRGDGDNARRIPLQHIRLAPGGSGVSSFRSDSKRGLYLLSAASVLLLLIACANLANLLLARGLARMQQTALRLSLGATRPRLIRAALTESLLLSTLGGAAGLSLAYLGTRAMLLLTFRGAEYIPVDASPSLPVLGFTLLVSLLTGAIFGIAPAWLGTQAPPSEGLRNASRRATTQSSRVQRTLVIAQAALSVVLLAVAGLVTQSLRNLESADLGFESRGRLLATVSLKAAGYTPDRLPRLYEQLQDRLHAIPRVSSASFSLNSPQSLCCINLNVLIEGRPDKSTDGVNVVFNRISPRYFETIGTPVVRGRAITKADTATSRRVAVVDQAFVRRLFPGEEPIGRHFGLSLPGHGYDYEIVGVVKDTMYRNPAAKQSPMAFLPFTQTVEFEPSGYRRLEAAMRYPQSIQLNVAGAPEGFEAPLRDALASINPNLAPTNVKTYTEHMAIQYNQQRVIARLAAVFSLLALVLVSVGLYDVTAYNVTRRTNEIGIRMALGANSGRVLTMVLRDGVLQVCFGLCIGVPLALLAGRDLSSQLYGVGRFDPLVLSGAIGVLLLSALLAGFLPARRAASIEPVEALRTE